MFYFSVLDIFLLTALYLKLYSLKIGDFFHLLGFFLFLFKKNIIPEE